MRINYNVSASIANKNLLGIESNLSQSMERLSSGLKINHAKDNPAGMAISRKMKAQIDGLDRASANASDGISVIHISDGALGEVTSILQRMRELSVQAASDATMGQEDKEAIQKEIIQKGRDFLKSPLERDPYEEAFESDQDRKLADSGTRRAAGPPRCGRSDTFQTRGAHRRTARCGWSHTPCRGSS